MTYNPLATSPITVLATARPGYNNTAFTIFKATPVKISPLGHIEPLSPAFETDIDGFAGVTRVDILPGQTGDVITNGTITNVSTPYSFGEVIYLSKTGALTNQKPSVGVAGFVEGDWVVRIGVIAQNSANPSLKDLVVNIQFVGQL